MGRTLQKIKHRNLILCEGTDDWSFLVEYLNSSERAKDYKRYSLKQRRLRTFKNEFKPKIHGFLSFTENLVGLKIGEAAKAGAFDWGSNQFDYLNTLLLEGFRIAEC